MPIRRIKLALIAASLWAGGVVAADKTPALLLKAQRVFDGVELHQAAAVLVVDGKIKAIGDASQLKAKATQTIDLGDATLLPGLIELHGHVAFQHVPQNTVLAHGITTVRDVGGPLLPTAGGNGQLRLLTAGPIITVANGYPLPIFGHDHADQHQAHQHGHQNHNPIAITVASEQQARQTVKDLIAGGAAVIKIALEPGGEVGAPWSQHTSQTPTPWPMLSVDLVKAISDEAHQHGKLVSAHLSEEIGVSIALAGGVDEWAHMPCLAIADHLLQQAVQQKVKVVATLDTLSHCAGVFSNTQKLAALGAEILYGAELAHADIPWGIDAHELQLIMHLTGKTALETLQTATSKAGHQLGLAPLGTITAGAPADLIAVKGDALQNFKRLEYPDWVMSGGKVVINQFSSHQRR
ncbi:MAG: amidohydrolase family protein [Methylomonas sp.]